MDQLPGSQFYNANAVFFLANQFSSKRSANNQCGGLMGKKNVTSHRNFVFVHSFVP